MNNSFQAGLEYKDAGVDISAGNALVQRIKKIARTTHRPGVISGIGGFSALFELPGGYQQPILVSSTDGVGTKLKLAIALNQHDTIGIDLVAMCVNDIIVCGAEPLFFLDYFATGHLNVEQATDILEGIAQGCKQAGVALVGGETAEMPGLYQAEDYDLAGFVVGIVEKSKIIDGKQISPGAALIALASSGPHSNGFSLIRKVIELSHADFNLALEGRPLGEILLAPTRIYVKPILELLKHHSILGMAHITGGGITENLPRILPAGVAAKIYQASWQWPPVFHWLQQQGQIAETEMYRTFNCGVGMILCVPQQEATSVIELLHQKGEKAWQIGEICEREHSKDAVFFE